MKIRIYLTTWIDVKDEGGHPLITDPIVQHLGPDRVLPGFKKKTRIKAPRDPATGRPNKAPCLIFMLYDDVDTSQIDAELEAVPGVYWLKGVGLRTRVARASRRGEIQKQLTRFGIPVRLERHKTIGQALREVAKWIDPDLPLKIREKLSHG